MRMNNKSLKTLIVALLGANLYCAAALQVGDAVPDITFTDFSTGEVKTLDDFSGSILVLDYFAYWCGPCALASAEMIPDIEEYYALQGGNPSGAPVEIISIDTDAKLFEGPTLRYAYKYQLSHLMVSESIGIDEQLGRGAIPFFAIINADPNSTTAEYGEILYQTTGYYEGLFKDEFRPVIDAVETSVPSLEPVIRQNPYSEYIKAGEYVNLKVRASAAQPMSVQWFKNGDIIEGANSVNLEIEDFQYEDEGSYHVKVSNAYGSAESTAAILVRKESFTQWLTKYALLGEDVRSKDEDNDGLSNFLEYVLGFDPASPSTSLNLDIAEASVLEGGSEVRLRYRVNNRAFDFARQLFISDDLENWVQVANQDFNEITIDSDINTKLIELIYPQNDGVFKKFFSLGFSDKNVSEVIRVGDTISGVVDEFDLEISEGRYVDIYTFSGLEDGQPVTIKVDTTSLSSLYVDVWLESDRSDEIGYAYYGEGFDSIQFVVDGDASYTLKVANYYEYGFGTYELSVETGEIYKEIQIGDELVDEKTDHAFGENTYVRKYKIINPPAGQLISIEATPKENSDGETPKLIIQPEDPNFGTSSFSTRASPLEFVPNSQVAVFTVSNSDGMSVADFDLKIKLTDIYPDLRAGETVQTQNSDLVTWTIDGEKFRFSIYLLQGLSPSIPVKIDVDGSVDDTRVLILNATTYAMVFKDIPGEVKSSETLTFIPEEGQYYFVAVGSTDLDNIADFTITVNPQVVE